MNNMICRKLRSRKGKKYFYCAKQRIEIPLEEAETVCAGCPLREYRQQNPLRKTPSSARAKAVSISPKVKKVVYGRDHGTCIFCGALGCLKACSSTIQRRFRCCKQYRLCMS